MAGKGKIWRRSIWRAEVKVRVTELTNRLSVAAASGKPFDAQQEKAKDFVEASLKTAWDTAGEAQTGPQGLVSWWTGDSVAIAWEAVHEAEVGLVRLEDPGAVKANLPWLIYWIRNAVEDSPRRRRCVDALEAQEKTDKDVDRVQIEQAYREVIVANSDRYANLRAFRNTLILVTGVLFTLVSALVIWHAIDVDVMTLCSSEGEDGVVHCLDGANSHAQDLGLVALVGAIGGMLAIAFGLNNTETLPSRYDPRTWLALLKPVAGAATAMAGLLLLQANLLIEPAGSRGESALLAYALLFGFSQQLFTQFVDKRAGGLIEAGG